MMDGLPDASLPWAKLYCPMQTRFHHFCPAIKYGRISLQWGFAMAIDNRLCTGSSGGAPNVPPEASGQGEGYVRLKLKVHQHNHQPAPKKTLFVAERTNGDPDGGRSLGRYALKSGTTIGFNEAGELYAISQVRHSSLPQEISI